MKSLIKSTMFASLSSFLVIGQLSHAQNTPTPDPDSNTDVTTSHKRFWEADLPGGNYMVALDRVSSISMHSYVVNKSLVVHEVVIQTNGAGLVRFYTFESVGENGDSNIAKNILRRGKELTEQGSKRLGVNSNTTVEKEYPLTTHSKTIEYKVFDKADLNQLYASIKRSWKEGRGRKFSIK